MLFCAGVESFRSTLTSHNDHHSLFIIGQGGVAVWRSGSRGLRIWRHVLLLSLMMMLTNATTTHE